MKLFKSIGWCYCETESNGSTTLKDLGNRIFNGNSKTVYKLFEKKGNKLVSPYQRCLYQTSHLYKDSDMGIFWYSSSDNATIFSPVINRNSALYQCQASRILGDGRSVYLRVEKPAKLIYRYTPDLINQFKTHYNTSCITDYVNYVKSTGINWDELKNKYPLLDELDKDPYGDITAIDLSIASIKFDLVNSPDLANSLGELYKIKDKLRSK